MIPALGICLALALALRAEPPSPRADKSPPTRVEEPPPAKPEGANPAPPPLSQEDAAVVENLELLQGMELLDDLPVVDTGDDDDPPPPAPKRDEPRR